MRDTGDEWLAMREWGGIVELAGILIFEIIIAAVLLVVAIIASIRLIRFVLYMIVAIISGIAGTLARGVHRRAERRRSRRAERVLGKQRLSGVTRIDPHFDPDFRRRSPE
jgi:hypothetical protein